VNGVLTTVPFFPGDPRPLVQAFVKNFTAKFNAEPDAYNGRAYDTIALLAELMRQYGTDRRAIKDGLAKIKDVPSVIYGTVRFDPPPNSTDRITVNGRCPPHPSVAARSLCASRSHE
jgi:branched-chain amino acid transport system substrate-binding protein